MEGWGRYSGYFFKSYKGSYDIMNGPFPTRLDAEAAASQVRDFQRARTGRIFQKEKPVNFNPWTGRGY